MAGEHYYYFACEPKNKKIKKEADRLSFTVNILNNGFRTINKFGQLVLKIKKK